MLACEACPTLLRCEAGCTSARTARDAHSQTLASEWLVESPSGRAQTDVLKEPVSVSFAPKLTLYAPAMVDDEAVVSVTVPETA